MAPIANQQWISIRNIIIYLETKFRPNRRIIVFKKSLEIQKLKDFNGNGNIQEVRHVAP
jgi:hypothetical protein